MISNIVNSEDLTTVKRDDNLLILKTISKTPDFGSDIPAKTSAGYNKKVRVCCSPCRCDNFSYRFDTRVV
jgi:hypothetical protein